MGSVKSSSGSPSRQGPIAALKQALRAARLGLALLNHRIVTELRLKDVDLDCLDLIGTQGPLSPTALARRAGLHPATLTGILDRLEQGGWVARERDSSDRRAVVVRARLGRGAELARLYKGMNRSLDEICAQYQDSELELIAQFLGRVAEAASAAAEGLANET
jgi:DNA-binding MarR family transcriptional regulator